MLKTKLKEIKEDCIVTKMNIFYIWVCSRLPEDESLKWVKRNYPAGTSNNWGKIDYTERPDCKPIQCADYPDRTHFQFVC